MSLKLYHSPGACSLAVASRARRGRPLSSPQVISPRPSSVRRQYLAINPKGRVPALADGDWVLTEVPAILRYVARTGRGLWPRTPATTGVAPSGWRGGVYGPRRLAHVRRPERYASSDAALRR